MHFRNTEDAFGIVAKSFHWVMAALVLFMLGLGLYMTSLEPSPALFKWFALHKSIGIVILALVVFRFAWRLVSPPPSQLPSHQKWEKVLAKISHWFFYAAMLTLPLSGWVMSSAKDYSVSVFNLFTLPDLVGPNEGLAGFGGDFHQIVAYILIGIIGLHFAGALKHHVIDRDATLLRMLPFGHTHVSSGEMTFRSLLCGLVVLMGLGASAARAEDAALAHWKIVTEESAITFSAVQMGAPFEGSFGTFSGDIHFDEAAPEKGHGSITIDTKSVKTGGADRDKYLPQKDWFAVDTFPSATYAIKSFEKTDAGYVAKGDLTIRDVTKPLDLPFTLSIDGDTATAEGAVSIKRLDFGVGQGDWKDTSTVADEVGIKVKVKAAR